MAGKRIGEAMAEYVTPPINRRRLPKSVGSKPITKSEAFGQTMYGYYRSARNKKARVR